MLELRSEALRKVGDRARELDKLRDHPSWDALDKEFKALRDVYVQRLARRMYEGGMKAKALDQRELDYRRGFIAGAEWILELPDFAIEALDEMLSRLDK